MDSEQQKVTISGSVDSATLIKKLVRADFYEHDEMQFIRKNINQLALLKQQAEADAKKGNNNTGKKGNTNQNMGIQANSGGGIDQKILAALKMKNEQLVGGKMNQSGEGKRVNDIGTMMNVAGFLGHGAQNIAAVSGGNSNGFQGAHGGGFPTNGLGGGQNNLSSMMMGKNGYQQQPQMISPFVPPSTGYYYYNIGPVPYNLTADPGYGGAHSATHMLSDENTSSCSMM
ncbi:hypothetical protein CDL12_01278 [Handroanthus impetiginosus]|uniref:HMA domain-containing protein n=1 Tax=Handroanthus impetiginosus TaxID=429701 RepID=A0A2G9I8B7_9LAMI|nr:hypothetical protein CDL12_01278 [Handroanthus impetiginosus]